MLRKLNNDFSISIPEFTKAISKFIEKENVYAETEKVIDTFKTYFKDDDVFDTWVKSNFDNFHSIIPDDIKSNCKVCNGDSINHEDMSCIDQYKSINEELVLFAITHVNFVENNKHLFQSEELVRDFTMGILNQFKFDCGEFKFKIDEYNNIILTHTLLMIRERLSNMTAQEAVNEINVTIEILETNTVIANSTDRVLSGLVKPQLKFFRKQLKHYKSKLLLENQTSTSEDKDDEDSKSPYDKYNNVFCKSMAFDIVIKHFEIFTTKNSKNGKPFLTVTQFDNFIKRAFCGEQDIDMQEFNTPPRGEKMLIQYRFRQFYELYYDKYFNTVQVQDKFIKLLTDNFVGWDYNKVKNNFKYKPQKTIEYL